MQLQEMIRALNASIAADKLEKCFEIFQKNPHLIPAHLSNTVLLISNQFKRLEREFTLTLLSREQYQQESAKNVVSLIHLVKDLETTLQQEMNLEATKIRPSATAQMLVETQIRQSTTKNQGGKITGFHLTTSDKRVVIPVQGFISKTPITIGRSPDCDIVINEPFVSRRHAQISLFGDHILVEDLNSSNGTFINFEKIDRRELRDEIKLNVDEVAFILRPLFNE